MKLLTICVLSCMSLPASTEDIQKVKDLYTSTFAALHEAKTMAEIERLTDAFQVPEWTGEMPAGEPLTRESALRDGEMVVSIPPEKRPSPQFHFVYVTESGWNILAVYWQYRQIGDRFVGALCRDTWVRTAQGWRRVHTQKFFPDRTLGEADFLPALH